jgi:hypothetical protein
MRHRQIQATFCNPPGASAAELDLMTAARSEDQSCSASNLDSAPNFQPDFKSEQNSALESAVEYDPRSRVGSDSKSSVEAGLETASDAEPDLGPDLAVHVDPELESGAKPPSGSGIKSDSQARVRATKAHVVAVDCTESLHDSAWRETGARFVRLHMGVHRNEISGGGV